MKREIDLHHLRGTMTYEELCRGEEFITEKERSHQCSAIPLVDTITSL